MNPSTSPLVVIALLVAMAFAAIGLVYFLRSSFGCFRDIPLDSDSTPNTSSAAPDTKSPRITINIPPDLKAMAPLPGDTSVEGQRAVLFYTVFREAMRNMNPGSSVASEDEIDTAADVAERAVAACYGEETKS